MLRLEDNMKTLEKLFPELYGFIEGEWYIHKASGSIARYLGLGSANPTFGINPSMPSNTKDDPKEYWFQCNGHWYADYSELNEDWETVTMDHVINMFKKYFEYKGYKIGAKIHFMHTKYIITDDWYFDKDSLYMVCKDFVDEPVVMHIPLIYEGNLNTHSITLM